MVNEQQQRQQQGQRQHFQQQEASKRPQHQYIVRFHPLNRTFVVLSQSSSSSSSDNCGIYKEEGEYENESLHNDIIDQVVDRILQLPTTTTTSVCCSYNNNNNKNDDDSKEQLHNNHEQQRFLQTLQKLIRHTTASTTTITTTTTAAATRSSAMNTILRIITPISELNECSNNSNSNSNNNSNNNNSNNSNNNSNNNNNYCHYVSCTLQPQFMSILGGKGGFGTLLKGQSKQSSVNTTKNFTACRNLQGQRLHNVNDTIHQQIIQDYQERIRLGTATEDDMRKALINTKSGIPGWHLPLPSWSEVNVKQQYKMNQRMMYQYKKQQKEKEKQFQQYQSQKDVLNHQYMNTTNHITNQIERKMYTVLQKGMQKQQQQLMNQHKTTKNRNTGSSSKEEDKKSIPIQQRKEQQRRQHDYEKEEDFDDDGDEDKGNSNQSKRQKLDASVVEKTTMDPTTTTTSQPVSSSSFVVTMSGTASIVPYTDGMTNEDGSNQLQQQQQGEERETLHHDDISSHVATTSDGSNKNNPNYYIQGSSNFCTIGIPQIQMDTSISNDVVEVDSCTHYYFEVVLVTKGIVQIGWASTATIITAPTDNTTDVDHETKTEQVSQTGLLFQPNSENGDGVGDCLYSWGYDPSRYSKLHNGTMESYGILETLLEDSNEVRNSNNTAQQQVDESTSTINIQSSQSENDVIGCFYNRKTGEISYSRNATSLGVAFTIPITTSLFPVVSCNENEIISLHIFKQEMKYYPVTTANAGSNILPIGDLLLSTISKSTKTIPTTTITSNDVTDQKDRKISGTEATQIVPESQKSPEVVDDNVVLSEESRIDLKQCASANELEKYGLQRLKVELQHYGLKCGGTVVERAQRLFAIRHIDDPKDYPPKLVAPTKK